MRLLILFVILVFSASIGGAFFVLEWGGIKQAKEQPEPQPEVIIRPKQKPAVTATTTEPAAAVVPPAAEAIIKQAEDLIAQTQEFIDKEKEKELQIQKVLARSAVAKGIYAGAAYNKSYFKNLLDETSLDSIVIDVKEYYGTNLPVSLKNFIGELKQKDIWTIARIVVFRDSSLLEKKPEWYLMATSSPWRDAAGQNWLNPQSIEVQDHIIEFSKKVIDFGFDELQFDYIRYPDDYATSTDKQKVIGAFFAKASEQLKAYKPTIILSADLFGYIATQFNSTGTGQRLIDAGKYFDYLSFMLYPSHFYGGFSAQAVSHTYPEVVEYPYDVVYYSIISAREYLSLFDLGARIRPWLQDFDLAIDSARGVFYDAEKVKAQIDATQNASSTTWLLWNSSYIYTTAAIE